MVVQYTFGTNFINGHVRKDGFQESAFIKVVLLLGIIVSGIQSLESLPKDRNEIVKETLPKKRYPLRQGELLLIDIGLDILGITGINIDSSSEHNLEQKNKRASGDLRCTTLSPDNVFLSQTTLWSTPEGKTILDTMLTDNQLFLLTSDCIIYSSGQSLAQSGPLRMSVNSTVARNACAVASPRLTPSLQVIDMQALLVPLGNGQSLWFMNGAVLNDKQQVIEEGPFEEIGNPNKAQIWLNSKQNEVETLREQIFPLSWDITQSLLKEAKEQQFIFLRRADIVKVIAVDKLLTSMSTGSIIDWIQLNVSNIAVDILGHSLFILSLDGDWNVLRFYTLGNVDKAINPNTKNQTLFPRATVKVPSSYKNLSFLSPTSLLLYSVDLSDYIIISLATLSNSASVFKKISTKLPRDFSSQRSSLTSTSIVSSQSYLHCEHLTLLNPQVTFTLTVATMHCPQSPSISMPCQYSRDIELFLTSGSEYEDPSQSLSPHRGFFAQIFSPLSILFIMFLLTLLLLLCRERRKTKKVEREMMVAELWKVELDSLKNLQELQLRRKREQGGRPNLAEIELDRMMALPNLGKFSAGGGLGNGINGLEDFADDGEADFEPYHEY